MAACFEGQSLPPSCAWRTTGRERVLKPPSHERVQVDQGDHCPITQSVGQPCLLHSRCSFCTPSTPVMDMSVLGQGLPP